MATVVDDTRQHYIPRCFRPLHSGVGIRRKKSTLVTVTRLAILLCGSVHGLEAPAAWVHLCDCLDGLYAGLVDSDGVRPNHHRYADQLQTGCDPMRRPHLNRVHRVHPLESYLESNHSEQRSRRRYGLSNRGCLFPSIAFFFGKRHDSVFERRVRVLDVLSQRAGEYRRAI